MIAKKFIKNLVSLSIISCCLYFLPPLVSLEYFKESITNKLLQEYEINLKISGDIHASLLPSPVIVIQQAHATLQNEDVEIPKLSLHINPIKSLIGEIDITGFEILGSQLNYKTISSILEKVQDKKNKWRDLLRRLSLKQVSIVLDPASNFLNKIEKIDARISYLIDENLLFEGSFTLHEFDYRTSGNIEFDPAKTSTLMIANRFMDAQFEGNMSKINSDMLSGKVHLKLFDNIAPESHISPFYKAILQDNAEADGTFTFKDDQLNIENFSLASQSIKNVSANLAFGFGQSHQISLNIKAASIDFDTLLAKVNAQEHEMNKDLSLNDFLKSLLLWFDFSMPDNVFGNINVEISKIIYNKQSIENVLFNSGMLEGKFSIGEVLIDLPGKSKLMFKGSVSHNNIRPKFDGKLLLQISDFQEFNNWIQISSNNNISNTKNVVFKSDISLIPRNMRFDNMSLESGDFRSEGKMVLKYGGDNSLSVRANVRANQLDCDTLGISKAVDEAITSLYAYDFEKSGQHFSKMTNDFKFLRDISENINLDLVVDSLKYKGITSPNFFVSMRAGPNNASIEQLKISNKYADIRGSVAVNTAYVIPKLTANLDIAYLNKSFFDTIMPAEDLLISAQRQALTEDPEAAATAVIGGANFFSTRNILGDIKLKISEFIFPDIKLSDLSTAIRISDGIAYADNIKFRIFDGLFDGIGSVVFSSTLPSYSLSFALNNFRLQKALKFYANYNQLDAYTSVNGQLHARGSSMDVIYQTLEGDLDLLSKKISLSNFNIGDIIRLSESQDTIENKQAKLEYSLNSGESIFDEATGKVSISKGMLNLKDLQFKNARVSGASSMTLNIASGLMSTYTKISFIPLGRNTVMSIDAIGAGAMRDMKYKYQYDKYLEFLKSNTISNQGNVLNYNSLLRNKKF